MLNFNLKERTDKHRMFLRFMFSYISILLIPILIGSLVYVEALKIVEKDSRESKFAMLEQSKTVLDMRLIEADRLAMQISLNKKVAGFVSQYKPFDGVAFYSSYEVINDLKPYWISNDFIKTFYVYFRNSDRFIC